MKTLNTTWYHWVVRAHHPHKPFSDFESAQSAWMSLEKLFPEKIAAVLMPNHCHLILPGLAEPAGVYRRLGGMLSGVSRRSGIEDLWQPIPTPAMIPDKHHLRRQIRYVALNPCRKALCTDPLEWYWSTYRDIMGAILGKREPHLHLATLLGEPPHHFRARFHKYVSGDPSVNISSTPLPFPEIPKKWPERAIMEILHASAAALRTLPARVETTGPLRTVFIHLAHRHGWKQASLLAEICKLHVETVRRILKRPTPVGIEAADLCLGDIRLRRLPGSGKTQQG